MNGLFSYDDLGVLTESFGRAPDDDLLARLLTTARDLAEQRYQKAMRVWPETLAAYQGQLAAYDRRMSNWMAAKDMSDRMARAYEADLARWNALPNRADFPSPTPPLDAGPAPEMPEAPVEPQAPTDADAIALLMDEQRAAVERARLEPKPERRTTWRQEIEDTLAWLMTPGEPDAPSYIDRAERADPVEEVVGPLAALKAKIDAVRAGQQELTPDELLQMYRDDPPGAAAKLEDAVRALKGEARRKLSELLNVELAELKNLRGMAGEDREREQQIEYLLGLFTRLGEI